MSAAEEFPMLPHIEPTPNVPAPFDMTPVTEQIDQDSRLSRMWHGAGRIWLNNCIRLGLVMQTANDEYYENMAVADDPSEKKVLRKTARVAVSGQVYERLRGPEVIGIGATLRVYQNALEHGANGLIATGAAALAMTGLVYAQQKYIGKNFVRLTDRLPDTAKSINQLWSKSAQAAQDARPDEDNRIAEGIGMMSLGTTPFLLAHAVANPELSKEELTKELYEVEDRVTKRGSVAAGATAAFLLGMKSSAPYLPKSADIPLFVNNLMVSVKHVAVQENAVAWSNELVNVASNPFVISSTFIAWAGLKAAGRSVKNRHPVA